ncbi:sigma-70 family RNA polymerase sigma factor [Thermomicrobium sp. 4228-Ro]|uniref:RNA polymerase sigma factor n=1 Tax=Thermomicrobium sp. 4228-Ro TaxID=2993937 RepID=UPI00224988EA|nr:sigma-70 family RNA polymerase sigma factor [Thermomicrobium sp. 4228-Ro]MCX2728324.1 sigma-70 family RNA polymerase sigma factor [Thermomicrobium sp. 4228-Ro]
MDGDLHGVSDSELVGRIRQRDRSALAALYDRYARTVYSLVLSIVHDRSVAEDIVQELFVQLWQYPELYDAGRGAFAPWFLRMARNRAIDALRRRQRDRYLYERLRGIEWRKVQDDPDELTVLGDEATRIRQAFADLENEQRQVIELAYFGGLTQREIAEYLGIPLGTVKTRIRTALQRLADALAGEREPWGETR